MKVGADGRPEGTPGENEALRNTITGNEAGDNGGKLPPKEWFANFWYFHKWSVIVAVVLIFGVAISMVQLFTNTEPDTYIMFVGKATLSVKSKNMMEDIAQKYMNDVNGDGKLHLGILELTVGIPADSSVTAYSTNNDAVRRFNTEVFTSGGEAVIYLLEESFYKALQGSGVLVKLSDVLDADQIPENTYDEYGVRISELEFFTQIGYDACPDNVILCMRRLSKEGEISNGWSEEYWESNKKLFKSMFTYRVADDPDASEASEPAEKTVYDITGTDTAMMYIGGKRIYEETAAAMSKAAINQLADADGDNAKRLGVLFRTLTMSGDNTYEANADDAAALEAELESGKILIFAVEKSFYAKLLESGTLVSLNDVLTVDITGGESYTYTIDATSDDGFGIRVGDIAYFRDTDGFKNLDPDCIICIRSSDAVSAEYSDACVSFFRNILTYKSPAKQ